MFLKIKKNEDFRLIYRKGRSKANKYLVMYFVKRESGPNRYGFSVSKKVGNSVVRHRVIRLLRESIRKDDALLQEGNDIIIVARRTAKGRTQQEIDSAVLHLCKMNGLLK